METVLVTGGSGFLAQPCLEELVGRAQTVHAVSRSVRAGLPAGVQFHSVDLLNAGQVHDLLATVRPSHLLHLAWMTTPGQYWTSPENLRWVTASMQLLSEFAVHGGKRAVIAGSCAEYDWSGGICSETSTPLRPATLYGECKNSLRASAEALAQPLGLALAWGRLFFLYGPREHPQRLVSSVILSLLRGHAIACSEGKQLRDFLHVEDAAAALVTLLASEVTGPINVASGAAVSVREVVQTIAQEIGRPDCIQWGQKPIAAGEPNLLVADVSRIQKALSWRPRFDLPAGLAQTINWWKTQ
jgi:nucleoside-diphosphate-sugar epimerase